MEALGMNGLVAVVTPMDSRGLNLSMVPAMLITWSATASAVSTLQAARGMLTEEGREPWQRRTEHCRGRMRTVVQVGHNSMRAAAATMRVL